MVSEWLDILRGDRFAWFVCGAGTGGSLRWAQAFPQAPMPGSGLVALVRQVVVPSPGLGFAEAFDFSVMIFWPPNKSPEPTAVGAVSSAVAVHVAGRRWLSFLR